jgi:hypothetical protein
VGQNHLWVKDVFPDKEESISLIDAFHFESFVVFINSGIGPMIDYAFGLIMDFPSSFPSSIGKLNILNIERRKKFITI